MEKVKFPKVYKNMLQSDELSLLHNTFFHLKQWKLFILKSSLRIGSLLKTLRFENYFTIDLFLATLF